MDILDVGRLLPQRPPILILDKVVDLEPGLSGTGKKQFRAGDSYFEGHFPDRPILPGVYLVEAMAQTAMVVVLAGETNDGPDGVKPVGYLAKIEKMSFYRTVEPDQEISFHVGVRQKVGRFYMVDGRATHGEEVCARGGLILAMEADETAGGPGLD